MSSLPPSGVGERKAGRNDARSELRRRDRGKEEPWVRDFIRQAPLGFLATVADDGQPFLNSNLFVCDEDRHCIYLHTHRTGRTRDNFNGRDGSSAAGAGGARVQCRICRRRGVRNRPRRGGCDGGESGASEPTRQVRAPPHRWRGLPADHRRRACAHRRVPARCRDVERQSKKKSRTTSRVRIRCPLFTVPFPHRTPQEA